MIYVFILIFIAGVSIAVLRQVNEYERGIVFSFGKFNGIKMPGWRLVIPVFQRMLKIDMRAKVIDIYNQKTITKDNIPIEINATVHYKISDMVKAVFEIENFFKATFRLAQITTGSIISETKLNDLLSKREKISDKIEAVINKTSSAWGIAVNNFGFKEIVLPPEIEKAIVKQAEIKNLGIIIENSENKQQKI